MDKLYIRQCEMYTLWEASKPIEINIEDFRSCEPPFEGETHEEFLEYFKENVWFNEEFAENEINLQILGDNRYEYLDWDGTEVYSDTRNKYAQQWLDLGVPNEEWRKMGNFEVFSTTAGDS
jgi:hypothetical protein